MGGYFSAEETLRQLGGRRFIAMTGANRFVKGKNNISFKVPKAKNKIKYVKLKLNSMDTYDMEFFTRTVKPVKKIKGVYNDQLQEIFTRETGLYTRF